MFGALCALASFGREELRRRVITNIGFKEFLELVPEVGWPWAVGLQLSGMMVFGSWFGAVGCAWSWAGWLVDSRQSGASRANVVHATHQASMVLAFKQPRVAKVVELLEGNPPPSITPSCVKLRAHCGNEAALARAVASHTQVREVVADFYACRYARCLRSLDALKPSLLLDLHLAEHVAPLYAQIRSRALVQYTSPFSSVHLAGMAEAFNTSAE